jgi:outer membrane protein OmpA-like peptidoglycan-associated protein
MTKFLFFIFFTSCSLLQAQYTDQQWKDIVTIFNEEQINTELTEFSPSYWNEFIVYVGSRSRQKLFDKNHNEPYYDLYLAGKNRDGQLDRTASFSKVLNTPYHEGPLTFNKEGNKIFFTRSDFDKGELRMNTEKIVVNKIFESSYKNDQWSDAVLSSFNTEEYTSCHPALDNEGTTIIFSSNRPNGYGKMDLYKTTLINGSWSAPENLGPSINTPENEVFPFIHENDILLYSSNYNTEKNDLDIYKIKLNQDKAEAISLPSPINTNYDDFGICIDPVGLNGYLSSNRPSSKGKDDIYRFSSTKSILSYKDDSYNRVKLTVYDQFEQSRLENVTIKLSPIPEDKILSFDDSVFDISDNDLVTEVTDKNGEAYLQLYDGYNLISVQSDGKEKWQKIISTQKTQDAIIVKLKNAVTLKKDTIIQYIEKVAPATINNVEVKEGATLIFNNIYYDYNSYEIKKGAAYELDELAIIMKNNPKLKILLSSHTDSRGEASYNQKLSENRAQAAKQYLVSKGVFSNQISTIGYGETQLRNHCKDGIKCSEAEHIYNRRTEVKILKAQ